MKLELREVKYFFFYCWLLWIWKIFFSNKYSFIFIHVWFLLPGKLFQKSKGHILKYNFFQTHHLYCDGSKCLPSSTFFLIDLRNVINNYWYNI